MPKGKYKRTKENNIKMSKTLKNYWKNNPDAKEKLRNLWEGVKRDNDFIKKVKIGQKRVIHHINGNHFDNRPENLMVMTQSEHVNLHRRQGDLKYSGKKKMKCVWCGEEKEIYNYLNRKFCSRSCYYEYKKENKIWK